MNVSNPAHNRSIERRLVLHTENRTKRHQIHVCSSSLEKQSAATKGKLVLNIILQTSSPTCHDYGVDMLAVSAVSSGLGSNRAGTGSFRRHGKGALPLSSRWQNRPAQRKKRRVDTENPQTFLGTWEILFCGTCRHYASKCSQVHLQQNTPVCRGHSPWLKHIGIGIFLTMLLHR